MKITLKSLFVLIIILLSTQAFSQRKLLISKELVETAVIAEVDAIFQSEEFLKKKAKKYPDVSGTIVVDIGVYQSGKVSSFFKVESDIKNIDFLNFISDYILKHKFKFKLEKQQRYKINYTAKFL